MGADRFGAHVGLRFQPFRRLIPRAPQQGHAQSIVWGKEAKSNVTATDSSDNDSDSSVLKETKTTVIREYRTGYELLSAI